MNISVKYHQNRSLLFWAIPFQSWCIFKTQCSVWCVLWLDYV